MTDGVILMEDRLARLLNYPGESYPQDLDGCRQALARTQPEAACYLASFADRIRGLTLDQIQELFIQTFDLNPSCALEVGWQLFGDNYDRGTFLVKMRRELDRHGLTESSELPDHLTHVLSLVARLEPDQADQFASGCVLPALEKVLAGLGGQNNPFENVLRAIHCVLSQRHARVTEEVSHE